jgi:hypothetical protein
MARLESYNILHEIDFFLFPVFVLLSVATAVFVPTLDKLPPFPQLLSRCRRAIIAARSASARALLSRFFSSSAVDMFGNSFPQ